MIVIHICGTVVCSIGVFFYPLWNGKYKIAIVERDVIFMKNNKKKQFIKSFAVQKQLEQNHFYAQKNEKKMVHRISTVGIVGNIVLTIFKQVA